MIKCRLCDSGKIKIRNIFVNFTLGACETCGFVEILERPEEKEFFTMYDDNFFKRGKYKKNKAEEEENLRRLSLLKKNGLKNGSRVLDAGCATGEYIKLIKDQYEVWGIDISEFAINEARINNPDIADRIKLGMLEDQDFPVGFFDCVVLWDVLEHLWDPVETMKKIVKILKPGGIVAISTPNIGAITPRIMGKHWHFMTIPEHLCFFDRNTIELLYKKVGLSLIDWETKGKWVNVEFLMYKINRMFPGLISKKIANCAKWINMENKIVYIPTSDIQYSVGRYNL